ncbi:MAG: MYXO-CTERM sorting domain-containing protein [Myxococcales bacterium]
MGRIDGRMQTDATWRELSVDRSVDHRIVDHLMGCSTEPYANGTLGPRGVESLMTRFRRIDGRQTPAVTGSLAKRLVASCLCTASALGLALVPVAASACPATERYETDPAEIGVDTVAPAVPQVQVLSVSRAKADLFPGICDIGWISLSVTSSDDRTPADKLGYVISLVEGSRAHLYGAELDMPRPLRDGKGGLGIVDGNDAIREGLDVTLAVSVVDLAGNRSAPTNVTVSDGGGCACSSTGASSIAWLPVLALLGVRRRRRSSPSCSSWRYPYRIRSPRRPRVPCAGTQATQGS